MVIPKISELIITFGDGPTTCFASMLFTMKLVKEKNNRMFRFNLKMLKIKVFTFNCL